MKKKIVHFVLGALFILLIATVAIFAYIAQPTTSTNSTSDHFVDPAKLEAHVFTLSHSFYPRNYENIENLEKSASYIQNHFAQAGAEVEIQEFMVDGNTYKNVIGIFGKGKPHKFIVGAHYDSCGQTPGADDNASGIAGLIELAYLIGKQELPGEIELVAYSLEEPPFFRTNQMGSYEHARKSQNDINKIKGVIVLEMIGLFSEENGSQYYPTSFLKLFYPTKGNFIAVIGALNQREFTKKVKIGMKGTTDLPIYSLNGPKTLQGIDYSDHRNYWPFGINAVMICDTAFYRNANYHELTDTFESLDYKKMSKVVIAVFESLRAMLD